MGDDLVPAADASSDPDLSFDLLAASLRADASELGTFVTVLGAKLVDALPDHVVCERERKRFLGKGTPDRIIKIEVTLDDLRFELDDSGKLLETRISHVVRGMRLKSDDVAIDEWIERLSRKLAETAERSAKSRDAIAGLLLS
jgi:hypothetical protein